MAGGGRRDVEWPRWALVVVAVAGILGAAITWAVFAVVWPDWGNDSGYSGRTTSGRAYAAGLGGAALASVVVLLILRKQRR